MNIRHISLAALLTIGLGAAASTPIIEVSEISAEVFDAARRANSNTMRADTVTDSRISAHLRTLALEEFMKLDESTRSHEYDYTPGNAPFDNTIIMHYPSADMYCVQLPNLHGTQAWCFDDNTYRYLGNIPSPVAISSEGLIMSQVYQDCDTPLDLYFYRRIGDTLLLRSNFMSPYYGVPFEAATSSDGSFCIGPTEIFSDYQCLRIKINDTTAYYTDSDDAKAVADSMFSTLRGHFSLETSGMVFVQTADERLQRPYMAMFLPRNNTDFQYYYSKSDSLEIFIKSSFDDAQNWLPGMADSVFDTESLIIEQPEPSSAYIMLRYDGQDLKPIFLGKNLPDCLTSTPQHDDAAVAKFNLEKNKSIICYSQCLNEFRAALATIGDSEMKPEKLREKLLDEFSGRTTDEICTLITSPYHRYEITLDSIAPAQSITYNSPDIYIHARMPLGRTEKDLYMQARHKLLKHALPCNPTNDRKCRIFAALHTRDSELTCTTATTVSEAFDLSNRHNTSAAMPTLLLLDFMMRKRVLNCF